jgi:hypothetical protein
MLALRSLRQHATTIENNARLRIPCPDAKNLAAHQKCASRIHIHDKVPGRRLTFVKRTVTGRARADTGNVKEGVNSPESVQARNNGIPYCKLVTDIRGSETCLIKSCRQSFAFVCINADNKHWIVGCPQARRRGRDSR